MGTPASKRKVIDLSLHADLIKKYRQAVQDEKTIKAYREKLGNQLKRLMGKAEEAEMDGTPVLTYARTESFAWAKFIEQHGDIADKYRIVVEKETYDFDKIRAEHPTLVAPFQTRQFLVK